MPPRIVFDGRLPLEKRAEERDKRSNEMREKEVLEKGEGVSEESNVGKVVVG